MQIDRFEEYVDKFSVLKKNFSAKTIRKIINKMQLKFIDSNDII
jgi:hypothetical protein